MAVFFLAPKPCAAGFYWQPNKHDGLQLTLLNKLVGLAFTKLLFYFQTKKRESAPSNMSCYTNNGQQHYWPTAMRLN